MAVARTRVAAAINPHLVFRVALADSAASDEVASFLQNHTTAVVVGVEADGAIVAFKDEVDLSDFGELVTGYRSGPKRGLNPATGQPYKTTTFDVLDYLVPDGMRLWSREDRIGAALQGHIGRGVFRLIDGEDVVVDVELWHPGTTAVRRSLAD